MSVQWRSQGAVVAWRTCRAPALQARRAPSMRVHRGVHHKEYYTAPRAPNEGSGPGGPAGGMLHTRGNTVADIS